MTQIWRIYNGYIPFLLVGLALWALVGYGVYRLRDRRGDVHAARRTTGDFLVSTYAIALLVVTMGPSSGAARSIELIPGNSVMDYIHHPDITAPLVEVLGNVIMWVPFPLVVGYRFPRVRARTLLWASILSALVLELAQLGFGIGRATSVDDVIAAAVGAGFGLAIRGLIRGREGLRRRSDSRAQSVASTDETVEFKAQG